MTGKSVQFFPVQSNAAQIEAMRAGRLHVAGVNTGLNPLAAACAGFRPFTMMASEDGSYGLEMEIITYPDSGIDKLVDLKDRRLAFAEFQREVQHDRPRQHRSGLTACAAALVV